jgi:predicted nucleic acid-binding Zn finger protein
VKKLDEKFYTSLSLSLSLYIYIYIGKSIDQKNYILKFSFCSWPSQQHIIGTAMCGFRLKICKQISQKVMADIDTTFGCHSKTSVGLIMVEILES